MGRKRLQFSLGTALLAIALVCVYLSWRFRLSPEATTVKAIEAAGGRAYFVYQEPSDSYSYISVGMLPDHAYFGQVHIRANDVATPPARTLVEVLTGQDQDRAVHTVELPLDQCTAKLVARLKSLSHLQRVVVLMPNAIESTDSPAVRRLEALDRELDGKVMPTYRLPW